MYSVVRKTRRFAATARLIILLLRIVYIYICVYRVIFPIEIFNAITGRTHNAGIGQEVIKKNI